MRGAFLNVPPEFSWHPIYSLLIIHCQGNDRFESLTFMQQTIQSSTFYTIFTGKKYDAESV